jgi:hypothetical protein
MTGPSAEQGERSPAAAAEPTRPVPEVRRRGWLEVRWRQFRRAPRPVVRAVLSSLSVAIALGVGFLAYDLALDRGASLPGGDLRLPFLVGYVVVVLAAGALITWLVVPLPTGSGTTRPRRTAWSAALGLFAAVPIAYIVLVVLHEIVKPLLG